MGQKIHPVGFRLSVKRNWSSVWYAGSKEFPILLNQDMQARSLLRKKLKNASVSKVVIERTYKSARAIIFSSKPGLVIGKKGGDIEQVRADLAKVLGVPVIVDIEEVRKPELDAQLVADSIAQQLEKRVMFRRAMKRMMQNSMRAGALGIKIMSSGRLNGADIARREWYREGRVPLHTLRADIDYALSEALTTYGIIGVKVWVYREQKAALKVGRDGGITVNSAAPGLTEAEKRERNLGRGALPSSVDRSRRRAANVATSA